MINNDQIALMPGHTRRQIALTRRSNKFHRVNRRILSKILSPRQNFVAATCRTKSTCDKILVNRASNVEAFTPGNLSLQPIAAMNAYDLSLDCTHKATCCSNVLQRFVALHVFRPFWLYCLDDIKSHRSGGETVLCATALGTLRC